MFTWIFVSPCKFLIQTREKKERVMCHQMYFVMAANMWVTEQNQDSAPSQSAPSSPPKDPPDISCGHIHMSWDSHVLRFTNLAEFTVRLFHSHLTTKTLFVFLGAWNAKVKLSSRAVPWWEKTEIATYNSGGVDSQISWKKYMWFEAWRVLLSRSATWNWESLRSCHFLCLKCRLTFMSEHSTNVLGNPQA